MRLIHGGSYSERTPPYGRWAGMRSYETAASTAINDANALYGQTMPGFSGDSVPTCQRVRIQWYPGGVMELANLYAYYEIGRRGAAPRQAGKMRLRSRSVSQWKELKYEPEGDERLIVGPTGEADEALDFGFFYQVVRGDNRINDLTTTVEIQTAYPRAGFQLGPILDLRGSVNDSPLYVDMLGTQGTATMLLLEVSTDLEWGNDLAAIDYLFARSQPGETWNEQLRVQKYAYRVRRVKTYDETDEATEITRNVVTSAPVEGLGTEPRNKFVLKNYAAALAGLTHW